MESTLNNNGNIQQVTADYYSDWIAANSGSLAFYIKYSSEARSIVDQLNKEDPYIARLRKIARDYSWSLEENSDLEVIPWQKFINSKLLADLQQPWSDIWVMPPDCLTPLERVEGLSEATLREYPSSEITTEDEYDQPAPLLDDAVSTFDYIREFTVPFDNVQNLANWIFTPKYEPASTISAANDGILSLDLPRKYRIKSSLETIYSKLKGTVARLQEPGVQIEGAIKLSWFDAAYADEIAKDVERIAESWERVQDLIGVMATLIGKLPIPKMPAMQPIASVG
ncbi:hypothetical protein TWF696_005676 [Orbilia brochopaga]|uniref:Uncharacterized protein n=1 Tax=Orbilia brochopaga TaxID=3140254 RepID=A0AAV9UUJ0_9PEZI